VSVGDFLIPFVLLLGILIFVHELGHFLVAKAFDVKVEKFSLGFGPALVRRRSGETEYVIGMLPLGGYVKMLGELPGEELPPDERERAFNTKAPWKRIAIALAGPAMNLLLPVFVVAALLMTGIPTLTSRVGAVLPDSPAERAGLLPGDRIVAVEGEPIWRWDDLLAGLRGAPEPQVSIEVERGAERIGFAIARERTPGGAPGPIGVEPRAPAAMIAVTDPAGAGARAGLRTGDVVVSLDGVAVTDLHALRAALERRAAAIDLEVRRRFDGRDETVRLRVDPPGGGGADARDGADDDPLARLGLGAVDFAVHEVTPASPARSAGLRKGDLVLRAGGEPVARAADLQERVRATGGASIELVVLRDGRERSFAVTPVKSVTEGEQGMETHYAIGIQLWTPREDGEWVEEFERNPLVALSRGVVRTGEMFGTIVAGLGHLVTGSVGLKSLAGPIGIGEIAADSFQASWERFFSFMAVISVNLAILNLLPIPVLDGGMILLTVGEWILGRPLSERVREVAQAIGLSLILVLMGFAFWNDLSRHWSRILGFFQDLL
jgi:regulator of sigma E protease